MKLMIVALVLAVAGVSTVSVAEANSTSRKLGITETKTDRIMPPPRRSTRR